jgi:hypothetical protein
MYIIIVVFQSKFVYYCKFVCGYTLFIQYNHTVSSNDKTMEKGYLQVQAEASRFDDGGRSLKNNTRCLHSIQAPFATDDDTVATDNNQKSSHHSRSDTLQPSEYIPHLAEAKYDPDHPDADWAGYVHRSHLLKKRHFDIHAKDVRSLLEIL